MSAQLPDSEIDAHDAPPPYDAVASPGSSADLPPEKVPPPDDIEDQDESVHDTEPPPPFTVTPGTLILAPCAVLIRGAIPGARPLYQLSRPLNGHTMTFNLMNMPANRRLKEDGTLREIWERDKLYTIYKHRDLTRMNAQIAEVSSQKPKQFDDVRLKKETSIGLTGVRNSFEATWGEEEKRKKLYHARQKKGILEWRDSADTLIAIDNPAVARKFQNESLEILVSLDKKHLDLLVALWMARIWHDTQAEGLKEDKEDARQRKAEQKQLDKEEGRPYGPVHDMKEALGIGYGLKTRADGLTGGMPAISQSGRINWGGSKS
ncbi:hypothetical protein N8I77_000116 [Diaporthe amygdali]|uniref:Uncharacterized protein n=1 Tax=Phomopsis amygdali TaxID=1214568 RepID=A0AAD9W9K2_PHOAM|nr:hypothetical protein N8I77_000116 [Diaporthe amygdali]